MNTLSSLVFKVSPFLLFTVSGNSMEPSFHAGQKLIASKCISLQKGDVVVIKDPRDGRLLLKRIKNVKKSMYFVEGDNKTESTDSRHFGWISKQLVIGKIIYPKS